MDITFRKQRALALWSEAQHYHLEGNLAYAIDLYTRSIEIFPTAEAYTYRGWAYSFERRYDVAIAECKKAIAIDPSFGNSYNDIGTYLLAQGKLDESIEWLEKAKQAPRYENRHFPYMNLGRVYAAKGMLNKAIAEFEQALTVHPREQFCLEMLKKLRNSLN